MRKITPFAALLLSACSPRPGSQDLARIERDVRAGRYANIHSVIVEEHGRRAAEWYFEGSDERRGTPLGKVRFGPGARHDVRSITKSVVSLLFGIAMAEGAIKSLDQPVAGFFPDYADRMDPRFRTVRLRHILSMTSGLRWNEHYPLTDPRNDEVALDRAPDRLAFILSRPLDAQPGQRFNYSAGDVELAAAVIERATKTPLKEYARRRLFGPLGVVDYEWLEFPSGGPIPASGLRMTPRDLLKLGELVLHQGRWEGAQIVPAEWIRMSTSEQVRPNKNRCALRYGFYWWIDPDCRAGEPHPWPEAVGAGGQRILIQPSQERVVVLTGGFYSRGERRVNALGAMLLAAPVDAGLSRPPS